MKFKTLSRNKLIYGVVFLCLVVGVGVSLWWYRKQKQKKALLTAATTTDSVPANNLPTKALDVPTTVFSIPYGGGSYSPTPTAPAPSPTPTVPSGSGMSALNFVVYDFENVTGDRVTLPTVPIKIVAVIRNGSWLTSHPDNYTVSGGNVIIFAQPFIASVGENTIHSVCVFTII